MISTAFIIGLALGAQAPSAGVAAAGRVVVLPLKGSAPQALRIEMEGLVRAAVLHVVPGTTVLDADATREALVAPQMMGLDCVPTDTACVARVAVMVEASRVLAGSVEAGDGVARVSLYLIDAASGIKLNDVIITIPTSGPARLSAARDGVVLLMAPERVLGNLRLQITPPGALIILDGEPIGTAPLAMPLHGLRAGRHAIRVEHDGFASQSAQVDVLPGQEALLELHLLESSVAEMTSPDEEIPLEDDAPLLVEGSGVGTSVLIAGGVAMALGGGVLLGAGGAALAIDTMIWNVEAIHENRSLGNNLFLGELVLIMVAVVGAGVLAVGGLAAATGGAITLLE